MEWSTTGMDRGLIVRVAFHPQATSCTAINPGDGNRNPYLRMPGRGAEFVPDRLSPIHVDYPPTVSSSTT